MIAIDTNILARFYCEDLDDPEADRQRVIARKLMVESKSIFVPVTVVLEFEWVMRAFYEASPDAFCDAVEHLLGMQHVTVDRWEQVKDAVDLHRRGLDFADALHVACSSNCNQFMTFDDRKFVRRARLLGLEPRVLVPTR